jgi:hypothetical protein
MMLRNDRIRCLYKSYRDIGTVKFKTVRWVGHVAMARESVVKRPHPWPRTGLGDLLERACQTVYNTTLHFENFFR